MSKRDNTKVHFCHITDSHLGCRQYGLLERFDDFAKALNQTVTKCIELSPQFVIFTGDLFDVAKPQAPELRQAVRILSRLQEEDIPMYLSQGNHDVSYSRTKRYGGDILSFLQDFGLFTYIQDEIAYVEDDAGNQLAQLLAVNYYGKRTDRLLNQILDHHWDEIMEFQGARILMLHAFVQGMPGVTDVSRATIQKIPFDYVAVGHLHDHYSYPDLNIYCPGSTEHFSTTEWKQPERGFNQVQVKQSSSTDVHKTHVTFIPIETRQKFKFKHVFKSLSVPEIREEAKQFLLEHDIEDAIVKYVFEGNYKGKEHPFFNLRRFRNIPQKNFHTIISTKFLEVQKAQDRKKTMSRREAYQETLVNKLEIPRTSPYLDEYISLIEDTLQYVSDDDITINEQEDRLNKRYTSFAKADLRKARKKGGA